MYFAGCRCHVEQNFVSWCGPCLLGTTLQLCCRTPVRSVTAGLSPRVPCARCHCCACGVHAVGHCATCVGSRLRLPLCESVESSSRTSTRNFCRVAAAWLCCCGTDARRSDKPATVTFRPLEATTRDVTLCLCLTWCVGCTAPLPLLGFLLACPTLHGSLFTVDVRFDFVESQARFKYPPHWVSVTELYNAMLPLDAHTGAVSRGAVSVFVKGLALCRVCSCEFRRLPAAFGL